MKQIVKTLSHTQAVGDWLGNTRHPRILHIFDHVCNLINERKEVISIVTPQIGDGPFNLVVGGNVLFSEKFKIKATVSIPDNQIQIDGLSIDMSNAKLWSPRPDWEGLYVNRNRIFSQLSSLVLPASELLLPVDLISDLSTALVTADIESGKFLASQLAGLGIGLTPTGDDIIMGALYATWIIHPTDVASLLVSEIVEAAAPLTTSLSAAWIRSAGKGEAGILWHELFDALISNNVKRTNVAMGSILSVGETSGADAFTGFMSVLISWMRYKKRIVV